MNAHQFDSTSPEATEAAAAAIGRACRGGEVILLSGPLGAGKTRFVRGLLAGLGGDARRVKSPTFGVLHRYPAARTTLDHFDAYFVRDPDELSRNGLGEFLAAGDVAVVEWAERIPTAFPSDALAITLAVTGETSRRLSAVAGGPRSQGLAEAFAAASMSL